MLGFVLRRLRGRLPLAAAVLLTALITTAVLTALVAFERTVGEAGLRQALQGPSHGQTVALASGDHDLKARAADDTSVARYADQLFGTLPHSVQAMARSRSYGLPGHQGKEPDLTVLAAVDRSRVKLTAGRWPGPAQPGATAETAVPQSLLTRLGLTAAQLPADVRLDDRYGGAPIGVKVTGVYQALDREEPYWRLDPLGGHEVQVMGFTTYGPMLVDDSAFTAGGLPQGSRSWLVTAQFGAITAGQADGLRRRVEPTGVAFRQASGLQSRTELGEVLQGLQAAELVARSTLLIGALQLAVLAAAALLLVVHLMQDRQAGENALLTARGAARRRLGAFTGVEALVLALPAAAFAPLLTPPLLTLLGHSGSLAKVPLDTGLPWLAWPVAAVCALVCVALTALPTLLRNAGTAALRKAGRRQALVAGAARSGADLALLVLAVLAYQQLGHYSGGGLSAAADGSLSVDPVLIAAPTLALCAGTVLVLRVLPYAARLGSRFATRGAGLGGALVGWQLARRPGRATGPVLLLVLAVSMGVLALGQRAAWTASQHDQAEFSTAGGLRITGSSVAPMGQAGLYGGLPGGDRMLPVVRADLALPDRSSGQLLALDTGAAATRLPIRSDLLKGRRPAELFGPLAAPAQGTATVPLPGRPTRVDVKLTNHEQAYLTVPPPWAAPDWQGAFAPDLVLLIQDRNGVLYRLVASRLPLDGDATVSVDLTRYLDGPLGSAAYPLSLAGVTLSFTGQSDHMGSGDLTIHQILVSDTPDGPAAAVTPPAGFGWQSTANSPGAPENRLVTLGAAKSTAEQLLTANYQAVVKDLSLVGVSATFTAAGEQQPIPAVATDSYLRAVGAGVGDVVQLPLGEGRLRAKVVAAVRALPVVGTTAIAVDLRTLQLRSAAVGQDPPIPSEWWLPATGPGDDTPAKAAAALRTSAAKQTVRLREEAAAVLLDDPVNAGPQSALAALCVAAAVLAAIGFAAATAAARGERAAEFAVLRALGASGGLLARTVTVEQGLLVGLGAAVGLALGTVLLHLIIPLILLTPTAQRPVPEVVIALPVGQALALTAAIAAVPLLAAVFGGRRQRDLVARLRFAEEM
ncbi:FtsX-like permease family protein [Kitasatospora sp. NPDC002227]|uniref:FtsX-like permease family protein n=1 Tax=Kitasatospora sp. NPDC002227 TaxID=3154773 RepID=UPI00332B80FB